MSKSIISNEKRCIVCQDTRDLHRHHIFFGTANRRLSEKHGCWVYLCPRHHNMSDQGVHFNKTLDLILKQQCQRVLENKLGWTREKMIEVFGRSYL